MRLLATAFAVSFCLAAVTVHAQDPLAPIVERELPSLVATYKALHAAPELSREEAKTTELLAREMRAAGYAVTERVGKYPNPEWKAYGLVAILENGPGPTVLVRTDLDGLPVLEQTGLPYASTAKAKDPAGLDVPVMHACGHDLHMSSWLGTARALAALRDRWSGRLMFVGQPAEERIQGAQAMLADRLYERFGTPDFVLALHDTADLPAGTVGYTPGYALAAANVVEIVVRGVGGHGSRPEATKDPVVLAAQIVMALQTIVSREVSPLDSAVVTVGTIHGGTKANIIPDEVRLQLSVRSYKPEVRDRVLASIERIARGLATAAGVPADRLPTVAVNEDEVAPATWNQPELTARLAGVFKRTLGEARTVEVPPVMGSEDVGHFALEGHRIPAVMFWLGGADPASLEQAKKAGVPPPGLHSSKWAPVPEPTIRSGVTAMTAAVLDLLKKK
jgi:hippurate hydrolase